MATVQMQVAWKRWESIPTRLAALSKPAQVFARRQVKETLDSLIENTPVSKGQGEHLATNWMAREEAASGPLQIIMYNALKSKEHVLRYLEYGTKPHDIRPKNKKWLSFVWKGNKCFAKIVHHPGTRSYAMINTAKSELEARINSMKPELLQAIRQEFERG